MSEAYTDYFFGKVAAHSCTDEWKHMLEGLNGLIKESAKKDEYKGPRARDVAAVGAGAAGAGVGGAVAGEIGREGLRRRKARVGRELEQAEKALVEARRHEFLGKSTAATKNIERGLKTIQSKRKTLQGLEKALGKGKWKLPAAAAALGATAVGGAMAAKNPDIKAQAKKLYQKSQKYV